MLELLSDIGHFVVLVFTNWVAAVTGATVSFISLAIERLFRKELSVRVILYGFIAFLLVAFFMAWRDQLHETKDVQSRLDELQKPHLEVLISQISITHSSAGVTLVLLQMGIFNRGSDSAVMRYRAYYDSPTMSGEVPIVWLPKDEESRAFPNEANMENYPGTTKSLMGETLRPIPKGAVVPGKLFLQIPGDHTKELSDGSGKITVTAQDYVGNEFSGDFPNNNPKVGILPFHGVSTHPPNPR